LRTTRFTFGGGGGPVLPLVPLQLERLLEHALQRRLPPLVLEWLLEPALPPLVLVEHHLEAGTIAFSYLSLVLFDHHLKTGTIAFSYFFFSCIKMHETILNVRRTLRCSVTFSMCH
jgi:hypothetical protein